MPYAVTEQMIDAFGEVIFDLSLNKQVRRGDPIRLLDHAAWQAQREETGLTDPEIAVKTGLACEQVTFIRNIIERRKFRLNQYRKLFRLGGGLRHREDRYVDPEAKFNMSDAAKAVRNSMNFAAEDVARYIREGLWTNETLLELFDQITDDNQILRTSAALLAEGVGRGDIVAGSFTEGQDHLAAFLTTLSVGGVYLVLPSDDAENIAHFSQPSVILSDIPKAEITPEVRDRLNFQRPVAADPALLLLSPSTDQNPRLAIHTHQTVGYALRLSSADADTSLIDLINGPAEMLCESGPGLETRENGRQARSPGLFAGYLNNPEADAASRTADGWFILKD